MYGTSTRQGDMTHVMRRTLLLSRTLIALPVVWRLLVRISSKRRQTRVIIRVPPLLVARDHLRTERLQAVGEPHGGDALRQAGGGAAVCEYFAAVDEHTLLHLGGASVRLLTPRQAARGEEGSVEKGRGTGCAEVEVEAR